VRINASLHDPAKKLVESIEGCIFSHLILGVGVLWLAKREIDRPATKVMVVSTRTIADAGA
jgi:hypothetical protein